MKKIFLLSMTMAFAFSSCQNDMNDGRVENPVQTGEEIIFGSARNVSNDMNEITDNGSRIISTRTIYENATDGSGNYDVYWASGDKVMVFCPQAAQSKRVNYTIEPNPDFPSKALTMMKEDLDGAGLQWGNTETHRFYGIYPADAVKGTEEENQTGEITMNIPTQQPAAKWRIQKDPDGEGILYNGLGNTDYAYMYAYKEVEKSKIQQGASIDLQFHPLTTVLEVDINGPTDNNEVTVTSINLEEIDPNPHLVLTGDFCCDIRKQEGDDDNFIGAIHPEGPTNVVRSSISVPLFINKGQIDESDRSDALKDAGGKDAFENKYIKLKKGDKIRVRMFFLRGDNQGEGDIPEGELRFRVIPMNGEAKIKNLVATVETTEPLVKNHMVNRVYLPAIVQEGINYWMSSINSNVYVSELSYPGSHQSAGGGYQKMSIKDQLDAGVRVFSFQLQGNILGGNYEVVGGAKSLSDYVNEIGEWLSTTNQISGNHEFAIVTLNYKQNGIVYQCDNFMHDMCSFVEENSYVYGSKVSSETTIGDVAGKIIVITRYNEGLQYGWSKKYMYQALGEGDQYHSLYAEWSNENVENPNYAPMNWGTSNFKQDLEYGPVGGLRLMYQDLTGVVTTGGGGQATVSAKELQMKATFKQGIEEYQNKAHNLWFMNNLGGHTDNDDEAGKINHATYFNNAAVVELQARTEDAALGCVLMNFADKNENSGVKYQSDWLIQTVINNNFNFPLRMKGASTPSRSEYVTRLNSKIDGWDE